MNVYVFVIWTLAFTYDLMNVFINLNGNLIWM